MDVIVHADLVEDRGKRCYAAGLRRSLRIENVIDCRVPGLIIGRSRRQVLDPQSTPVRVNNVPRKPLAKPATVFIQLDAMHDVFFGPGRAAAAIGLHELQVPGLDRQCKDITVYK